MIRTPGPSGDDVVAEIARSITAAWGGWSGPLVETAVFGTRDPSEIAALFVQWVGRHLNGRAAAVHWYHASVGCALALRLDDGRDVVVKAHQPRFTGDYLRAMTAAQQHLVEHWYPCPAPLGHPAPLGGQSATGAWATASTLRGDPGVPPRPDTVSAVAALVRIALEFDASEHLGLGPSNLAALSPHPLQAIAHGDLYPEPYSPTFRYRDAEDVGWIDSLAAAARSVMHTDDSEQIVTHVDWSARNLRGDDGGVSHVYDLDSLALLPEARAVGGAAVSWHVDDVDGSGALPLDSVEHFVWLYQRIRDRWFDGRGMQCVWAAVLWNLCYLARCEDAIGAPGNAVAALRAHGAELRARCGPA